MTDTHVKIAARYACNNVGATRRKMVHEIVAGTIRGAGATRAAALADLARGLEYVAMHADVVVAYDASGQAWAAAPTHHACWTVRRVAPDAGGCTVMHARDARDLRAQIAEWNRCE